jgi:Protein of unknown function (DUF2846)
MIHSKKHCMSSVRSFSAILVMVIAAGLAGCATNPFWGARDAATVYIFRLPGGVPGVYKPILVDGKSLGSLDYGGYFMIRLAPGKHLITSPSANQKKLELEVVKGADYYVSQEIIPANPPFVLLNRVGEKFGKPYVERSRRVY